MFRQLKKTLVATVIASLTLGSIGLLLLTPQIRCRTWGPLQEARCRLVRKCRWGITMLRQLRGSAPLINDPLLVQYINGLGMRLVAHANSVRTPFHFYLINNDQINAFAFFGGNVVLHSALFRYSDNEQRTGLCHGARNLPRYAAASRPRDGRSEAQCAAHLVGALGSILLAMASPQAGMAALTGTGWYPTGHDQLHPPERRRGRPDWHSGSWQRSGFDPQASADVYGKLLDESRYSTRPPEMLTHPCRKADWPMPVTAPTRCARWWYSPQRTSIWRARTLGMYTNGDNKLGTDLLNAWDRGNIRQQHAAQYGRAHWRWKATTLTRHAKRCSRCSAPTRKCLVSRPGHGYRPRAEENQRRHQSP